MPKKAVLGWARGRRNGLVGVLVAEILIGPPEPFLPFDTQDPGSEWNALYRLGGRLG